MKNLLIYISPTGSFDNPRSDLASNDGEATCKVQIDNSLEFGWKREDIMLVTNFPYEYNGVKAIEVEADFFDRKPQVSKINAILALFDSGMIEDEETYWFHDLDAFQVDKRIDVQIDDDMIACTDFGGAKFFLGRERFSGGVFYFRKGSEDLFNEIKYLCYRDKIDEEEALGIMAVGDEYFDERIEVLNNSFNFIGYNLKELYPRLIKPIKVIHFHPLVGKKRFEAETSLQYFMGDNPLKVNFVPDSLLELFKKHGLV